MDACTQSTQTSQVGPTPRSEGRKWQFKIDLIVILALIIATVWVGYPLIKDANRMESLRQREASVEQLTRGLRADARFVHVGVSVYVCKHPLVVGEVDCGETYADLKKLILSSKREKEIILSVRYPHLVSEEEDPVVYADDETIAPGN